MGLVIVGGSLQLGPGDRHTMQALPTRHATLSGVLDRDQGVGQRITSRGDRNNTIRSMVINGERRLTVQKEKLTKRLEGASVRTTLRPSWKVRSFHFIAKWITGWAGALTQVLSAVAHTHSP